MQHIYSKIGSFDVQIARCGYTGEDGFEISVKSKDIVPFCEMIFKDETLQPAGYSYIFSKFKFGSERQFET